MDKHFYLVKAVKQVGSGSWYYFPIADLYGDCDAVIFQMLNAYNREDMLEYKHINGSLDRYFLDQGQAIYIVVAEDEEQAREVAKTKHEGTQLISK